jgi:enolase-phosphatase E1
MDLDRKSPSLKRIQGQIWENGFKGGELKAELFPDVAPALARWKQAGIDVAIYSSGSVLAQRLIFGTTQYGDLTREIDAYFDTAVGPKRESDSYAAIARELGVAPQSILFLSDVTAELDAASSAGCRTALVARPGNPPQPSRPAMPTIKTLAEVTP